MPGIASRSSRLSRNLLDAHDEFSRAASGYHKQNLLALLTEGKLLCHDQRLNIARRLVPGPKPRNLKAGLGPTLGRASDVIQIASQGREFAIIHGGRAEYPVAQRGTRWPGPSHPPAPRSQRCRHDFAVERIVARSSRAAGVITLVSNARVS